MRKLALVVAFWSLSTFGMADTVLLKNGDRMTGTVDSISSGRVLLKTDYAGSVPIALEAIAELVTNDEFDIVADGARQKGRFTAQDGAQLIVSTSGEQAVELVSIKTAGQNNLAMAVLTSEWSSRADIAAKFSHGNTDTEQYSTLIETALKKGNVQHNLKFLVSNEKAEDDTTKDELDVDYLYKRFLSERWYASGNAEYFEDALKDVDSRITLGAGVGYQFWDDSFGALSTDVGLSYVREEILGDETSNPALRWGLAYKRYLFSKKMEAFHEQSLLFIPDSDRGEVFESSSGVRFALGARIDAIARVDVNHETKPAPGNSKTDVTYNVGVGIKLQ